MRTTGFAHADNGLARADLVRSRDLHAKVFLGV
jgi:hypothetical protein